MTKFTDVSNRLYGISVDGAPDQIVETMALAKKEKTDYERMGYEVRIRVFDEPTLAQSWARAERWMNK